MNLKQGDKGPQVREWQEFLNARGERLIADGNFGPMTKAATQRFQGAVNVRADGIVGANTYLEAAKMGFVGGGVSKDAAPKTNDKLYLISAGHTNVPGQDRGVAANGLIEGDEATTIRDHVAALMRQEGLSVIEDGADGQSEPLKKALILARKADVAVEFHFNAAENKTATGIEVLSKPGKKQTAQRIAGAIGDALGLPLRGDGGWKSDSSGQHHRLAFCEAGGLVVEICFLTNPGDVKAYEENFAQLCSGLADAIAG